MGQDTQSIAAADPGADSASARFRRALDAARRSGPRRARAWVRAAFEAEWDRLFLWLPVCVGIGVGVYFALPTEPPAWPAPLLGLTALAASVAARRSRGRRAAAVAAAAVAIGFGAAQLRAQLVAAPVLERPFGPVSVAGEVVNVEPFAKGGRVTLSALEIRGLPAERTPATVRLRWRGDRPAPAIGERISALALLQPPWAATAPGAFDFQRYAYFQRIGAVGAILGGWKTSDEAPIGEGGDPFVALRARIAARIAAVTEPATGAVMTALIVGSTTSIPDDVFAAVRDAGLAHLLSISGLHVGMVCGLLFLFCRRVVCLWPALALRVDARKVAAALSLGGCLFYGLLAGAPPPTVRALVMIALVILAVLTDRKAFSMRGLAWAALTILLLRPEALTGASFQMSFAAMAGLIAWSERQQRRRFAVGAADRGMSRPSVVHYVAAIVLSSAIAAFATAPFGLYHFNRIAVYGVLSNIVAIPVTGFWVMPWAAASLLAMPFGLEAAPLRAMALGVEVIIATAHWVADRPGSVALLPSPSLAALLTFVAGGLWLCLWRGRLRWLGAPVIAAGLALILASEPPDVFLDAEGANPAVRLSDGSLAFAVSSRRRAGLGWTQRSGGGEAGPIWPREGALDGGRLACDPLGCVYAAEGGEVAFSRSPWSLAEDCRRADLVVGLGAGPEACGAGAAPPLIGPRARERGGAHAIRLSRDELAIDSVGEARGRRPWNAPAPR